MTVELTGCAPDSNVAFWNASSTDATSGSTLGARQGDVNVVYEKV